MHIRKATADDAATVTAIIEEVYVGGGWADPVTSPDYVRSLRDAGTRIALATVLTMDMRLLVLDEPSAGLDPRARRSLITLLQSFTEQTLLISTHDMRLAAELCTRAVVLDAGQVVADGAVESVLYDRELMERHGLETP